MVNDLFLIALSLSASAAVTFLFTSRRRSLPILFLLLVALIVLFGLPALFGFTGVTAWRYRQAQEALASEKAAGPKEKNLKRGASKQ